MVHQTITINSAAAPTASSINSHMTRFLVWVFFILGALAGCSSTPVAVPAPAEPQVALDTRAPPGDVLMRPRARWVPASWSELPGWDSDRTAEVWPALLRSCERPAPGWANTCAQARLSAPADDAAARVWLQSRLNPYRIESLDGSAQGLITGYFEPIIAASRKPQGLFQVPLYAPPADLASRKPYWTRQELETLPAAQAAIRGRELAYLADPLALLSLQIQGSGRLQLSEPDGSQRTVRMAYAGNNDQPYKSVGKWLIEQGELRPDQASWPGIRAWAQLNPERVGELLWANPRVVFFREEALVDVNAGPRGAHGTALLSSTPLRRIVMAQDTGSAIVGAVRVDYFWGWDGPAEQQAGRMKQPLRAWVLVPKT
jgi:membrane-bound lytic murein transglycosylase A